jgi:predicted  nucleic acid-binding Zn-ribbon protein
MNFFQYLAHRRAVSRKRRALKTLNKWIFDLEDQVASGQEALRRAQRRKIQLEAQLGLLVPADELIRQLGSP